MQEIHDHKVNPANDLLKVLIMDKPGAGGANHEYDVVLPDGQTTRISFQNGPIDENGINGLTQEVLLEIVIHRLRSFQAGPFSCRENALALMKVEEAQHWLHHRTLARMRRGVEGKTLP
jgi:hypothetical protein